MQFSRLRFQAYARDLEHAILELSRERMAIHETRQALGMPDLTMTYGDGETEIWANGKDTAQLQSGASIHEIGQALNVTPVPENKMDNSTQVIVAEPLKRNVTGASNLGSSVQKLLAAIKGEVDAAHSELHAAAGEVRTGINTVKSVTKALRSEADDIKSSLGQFSNGGPE